MPARAHILVVGNAKGGSGKSTTAMHVTTRLLALGQRVACVDLDGRQQTLARYVENRDHTCRARSLALPMPTLAVVSEPEAATREASERATYDSLCALLERHSAHHDVIVLDCPGSDSFAARLGHTLADTLLTPLNDSFVDVDLLARIDPDTHTILSPSWYSEMIWEARKRRFLGDRHHIDWVVMRNRLAHTAARNKRHVHGVLAALAPRIGFRLAPGFGERVIFRELFLKGLTLSDLRTKGCGVEVTMNHVAAHQEVKELVHLLRLPGVRTAATPRAAAPAPASAAV
jgi:chromosome partitioning protein